MADTPLSVKMITPLKGREKRERNILLPRHFLPAMDIEKVGDKLTSVSHAEAKEAENVFNYYCDIPRGEWIKFWGGIELGVIELGRNRVRA